MIVRRTAKNVKSPTVVGDRVCDVLFFFPSRRRHTRFDCDWSSDVCSSDLTNLVGADDAVVIRVDPIERARTPRRPLVARNHAVAVLVPPLEPLREPLRDPRPPDRKSVV